MGHSIPVDTYPGLESPQLKGFWEMAAKGKRNNAAAQERPKFEDFVFINVRLSPEQGKAFKAWQSAHTDDIGLLLNEVADSGHKITITRDKANDCFITSFTCLEPASPNYCMILSSRSDDMWESVGLNLFKHYDLFSSGEWPEQTKQNWG